MVHHISSRINRLLAFVWQWQASPVLLPRKSHGWRSLVGYSPWGSQESVATEHFTFTFHFHAMEKEMATHSSVLAWRIPGTAEPGGLLSMGSHRVGHDWSDLAAAAAAAAAAFVFIIMLWHLIYHILVSSERWKQHISFNLSCDTL